MDFERVAEVKKLTNLPIIASSGAASVVDFEKAVLSGASAIAAGALFQFTEITPGLVRDYLSNSGIAVRIVE
jgi:cyclase